MRLLAKKSQHFSSRPFGETLATVLSVVGASVFAAGGVLISASFARPVYAQTAPQSFAMPNEIVIWVPGGMGSAQVDNIAASAGCEVVANLAKPSQYYLLRLKGTTRAVRPTTGKERTRANGSAVEPSAVQPVSEAVLNAVEKLKANTPGLLADPNWFRKYFQVQQTATPTVTPNDTYYPQQWDMRLINMPTAWQFQGGRTPIVAAVMDSGVDVNHPDFTRDGVSIITNPINVGNPANITSDVTDNVSHGTHVGGTMAAVANNSRGIAGVSGFGGNAVNIRLMPIKIDGVSADGEVFLNDDGVIAGTAMATQMGVAVINMSFGGGPPSTVELNVITAAIQAGTIIVAATGNDGRDTTPFPNYPSGYPGVIAVSSVGQSGNISSFSNYGDNITIAAPGGDFGFPLSESRVLSTIPLSSTDNGGFLTEAGYGYKVGTSMASPHVAGAVALLRASGARADEVLGILQSTATPLPDATLANGRTISSQSAYGAGLLNVGAALTPRLRVLSGQQLNTVGGGTAEATNRGTTYTRNANISLSLRLFGNIVRDIDAKPSETSIAVRIETATTPATAVTSLNIPTSALPTVSATDSLFAPRVFTYDAPDLRLGQGRYKAVATLTYRGAVFTQTQFFEVLDYVQPTGLTLFSVPFQPTIATGVSPEQQVLGLSTGFSVQRWNPLNTPASGDSVYAQYVPGDTARDDVYARLANRFHVADPLHPERGLQPLSYAVGSPTTSLAPIGVGFWLNTSESRTLQTEGVPSITPVAIPLFGVEDDNNNFRGTAGWNLIGAPFEFPVNWSSTTVRQNTPTGIRDLTLQEAINAEIINAQLVGWDVPTRSYNFNVFPGGQLLPFKAYWVRALRDCTIIVPPSRSDQVLTSRAKASTGVPLADGWRVRITASVAGDRDMQNYIGQTSGATDGEDKFDIAKPPTGPGYADVRFLGTNKRGKSAAYAYDMRPLKAGKNKAEWTMAVGAGKGDTDVTVTWDGLGTLPSRAKLTLRDTVTGRIVPMNGRSSYTYKNTEAGATRLFTVSLAEQNTSGPLQIRNIRAVPTGGTRGVSRGMNVRFALSQDANISGRIVTFSGKVVGTLSGTGRAVSQGEVQLRWDGRGVSGGEVPAGSYYVEITAETDAGESTTVKQPITVLR